MTAPCNCAARWSAVTCSCSWRDHLTKPVRVESGWLYDDGRETQDATLSGLVYPDGSVDEVTLTVEDGETIDVPREDRLRAEDDLRSAAETLQRSCA